MGLATAAIVVGAQKEARLSTVAAIAGAVLLDLDKPILHFIGVKPFPEVVNRIHKRIQNESPNGLLNEIVYGVSFASLSTALMTRKRRPGSMSRRDPSV